MMRVGGLGKRRGVGMGSRDGQGSTLIPEYVNNSYTIISFDQGVRSLVDYLPDICLCRRLSLALIDLGASKSAHQSLKKGSLKKSSLITVETPVE